MAKIFFRQFFDSESSTYTYILADPVSREGAIIDPVISQQNRDRQCLQEYGIQIQYILETHIHADHVTGGSKLKAQLGGKFITGVATGIDCADQLLKDGESLKLGNYTIKALSTPGHTDGCTSYYVEGMVFTGDALLIRGCGRTDFQQGSSEKLYASVTEKLFTLPDETLVYPAHDYNGRMVSTIGEEKLHNPRLGQNKTKAEFVEIMRNLNLKEPLMMKIAVPANMRCGYMADRLT